jgi:hypothetical protein
MNVYPDGVPAEVCRFFEATALDLMRAGFERYSADAILHRARWSWQVERGDRGFKINNCWSAPLARWFLARHPEAAGFFELRTARAAPIRAYAD